LLLVEADTGKVIHAERATHPWYPASVTKIMTLYVTLRAVKEGRISLDTLLIVSPTAAAQAPSKMGFKPGTQVTVDNALKMLMVKSANDMAVVLAEGISGSVENFATEMNRTAQRLGMTQTTYVNPNGLPADGQVTSARDLAILARALMREFPEHSLYWRIPAIKLGRRVMRNTNRLMTLYPGTNGMKTGFICASGFNIVATAVRDGKQLIAVVLGSHSATARNQKAAQLLEKGFNRGVLGWLTPSYGSLDSLTPIAAAPPNLREEICSKARGRPPAEDTDETPAADNNEPGSQVAFAQSFRLHSGLPPVTLQPQPASMPPVVVFVGPGKKSVQVAESAKNKAAAAAAQADATTPKPQRTATRLGAPILPSNGFIPGVASPALAYTSAENPAASLAVESAIPMPRPRPKRTAKQPASAR
jgi:D-alanyl-D-alanine carboxypeptidase